ncbi:hypothetical protein PI2015_0308 [Pseudoalteromonas issachenkonii]|jgi:hypothetical protein|uniref:Uncharacterized protein n=1 Tax=Pseudoalteromonas issachenkonii TaxID=152297 RepID=A0ABM6MZW2_9GAMM|nr:MULTISPECIES: hypothetical protein [Pseudoalteromonas]MAY58259.1 hypothetical protein [Pseudoalteromonas sp.]ALQ53638.1 hypothetical protein PI2015_0308 [Pseudoalteromonas issachenkonii]ATC89392.1 hypothetical protein PISS_a0334 [Pseudoalteromonas issachenkonii]MDN3405015.1 hypothetical protein [Pseudoalteromonas sp. APC 3218]MDN3408968.1 hypothetical protein [Pseudoalteromonas sp. APC 3894]|tara:strand:+ start:51537 stop:51836 length:300 start_codon:yes stop_codon:yes gene_type:complete
MRAFKIGLLITSVSVIIGATSLCSNTEQDLSSANICLHKEQTNAINNSATRCIQIEEDSSWASWLTGDSRSAQFHYLDLLELLTGTDDKHKPSSIKPLF